MLDTPCNQSPVPGKGAEVPSPGMSRGEDRANKNAPHPDVASPFIEGIRAASRLIKTPLTATAAFPAVCAFVIASPGTKFPQLLLLAAGTLLAGFGASALNQWSERSRDALMQRTCARPLPAGQLRPASVLLIGLALAGAGVGILFVSFPHLAAALATATVMIYWLIYTPLKTRTPLCTEAGAIAGAMPALIGSAAASGTVTSSGFTLFALIFFWQMPHFHPIAWRYREDYRQGGFRMLAVIDPTGDRAGQRAWIYTWLMVATSSIPLLLGAGWIYGTAAAIVTFPFVRQASAFRKRKSRDTVAPRLFRVSIIYLCVILTSLLVDHTLP